MGEDTNDHQLWVSLSALGEGNVFAILPDLMRKMLAEGENSDGGEELYDVILPSDDTWRTKIYYKLVEKQRLMDNSEEKMLDHLQEDKSNKLHEWNIKPKIKICEPAKLTFRKRKAIPQKLITWTVSDIAKAGRLLNNPPMSTNFDDEQEMRRVYTLIYDVFRYKMILTEALNDVSFFAIFPQLLKKSALVWLLLYDLYHRSFNKRETKVQAVASKLFDAAGLSFAENALWTQKVKLAASISRLRIKNNALTLSELLPAHLKDERVTGNARNNPVTCWVNINKISNPNQLCSDIEKEFQLKLIDNINMLEHDMFKWDKHCPNIIAFHSSMRTKLARSHFIKNYILILQDRSFCLGPATFGKLIEDLELTGSVIQTHVNSPRTTAYLAVLLSNNEKIKKLLAFSAGKRKPEYENYFNELGMSNISIFSDRLIDTPLDAHYMEEVVAVFATPPNSYSAVSDPIDLVCSRGGDLSMLQVLTESEDSKEGKERVANILDEQRKTLRFSMSRPQIQFVLYETHSELNAENKGMVDKAINDINKIAKIHHASLQGKISLPQQPQQSDESISNQEINNNEKNQQMGDNLNKGSSIVLKTSIADSGILDNIKIPETDIFDVPELPKLCPNDRDCTNLQKEGCYLALIQRKQIIKLDDKYMIQMAEHRGLFGSHTSTGTAKSKSSRSSKKKVEKEEVKPKKTRRKLKESEMERIAAPTYTFLNHIQRESEIKCCQRCMANDENSGYNHQYHRWWIEATRHIVQLKSSLTRKKLITPFSKKVDEVLVNNNLVERIPIFPKLKLTRCQQPQKIPVPLAITEIQKK